MPLTDEQRAALDRAIGDAEGIEREIFAEWLEEHPEGTAEEFEEWWGPAKAIFGF